MNVLSNSNFLLKLSLFLFDFQPVNICLIVFCSHCSCRYNVCISAYGQTGSGKTHTMLGSHKNEDYNLFHQAQPDEGVIPRAVRELFR